MKHFSSSFSQKSWISIRFLYRNIDLKNEAGLLKELSQGTEHLDTGSTQFKETVRERVKGVLKRVDTNQAKEMAQEALEKQKLSEKNAENRTEKAKENIEKESQSAETALETKNSSVGAEKKGFFKRMKESVGTYVGMGMKYGALIHGIIGLGIGSAMAILAISGGAVSASVLALPAIYGAASAVGGLIDGAFIGLIVGLIKKGVDKKRKKENA